MKTCLILVLVLAILGSGCSPISTLVPTPVPTAISVQEWYRLTCLVFYYQASYPSDNKTDIKLLTGQKEREPYERDLACDVYRMIVKLRGPLDSDNHAERFMRRYYATLFKLFMRNDGTNRFLDANGIYQTFANWNPVRDRFLSESISYEVGMRTCKEMGFTVEEVQRIYDQTPLPDDKKLQDMLNGTNQ
jgi:hypothetical protein